MKCPLRLIFLFPLVFLGHAEQAAEVNPSRELSSSLKDAEARYEESRADLFRKYTEALDRLEKELQEKGDLEGVIGVRKELRKAEPELIGEVSPIPALGNLQEILRVQTRKLEEGRIETRTNIRQSFLTQAEELKRSLTQQGRIDEAIQIQTSIDEEKKTLARERLQLAGLRKGSEPTSQPTPEPVLPSRGLVAHFSFDDARNGGLDPKSPSVKATPKKVKFVSKGGRTGADFNEAQAHIAFQPAIALKDGYTIGFWHLFPPRKTAFLLESDLGYMLTIQNDGAFTNYINQSSQTIYEPKSPLSGWHFVALAGKGSKTTYYLDGESIGEVNRGVGKSLKILGNRPGMHGHWSMANMIDDFFIYENALEPEAIARLYSATRDSQ